MTDIITYPFDDAEHVSAVLVAGAWVPVRRGTFQVSPRPDGSAWIEAEERTRRTPNERQRSQRTRMLVRSDAVQAIRTAVAVEAAT